MIRHIFKLIWNRKMRNLLLISEIFFSFLVLFAVGSMTFSNIRNYMEPLGFSYENVLVLDLGWQSVENDVEKSELISKIQQIYLELEATPEVVEVSTVSGNIPFLNSSWGTSIEYEGQEYLQDICLAGDDFARVLDIPILEGRWFGREDDASSRIPIVMESKTKEIIFGDQPALGKIISQKDKELIVVGIIGSYHYRGEFMNHRGGFFKRQSFMDTALFRAPENVIFSVVDGAGVQFEDRLVKRLSAMAPGWTMKIKNLEELHDQGIKDVLMGMLLYVIVAGFLIFNVALGLFGVLWYSISRRRGEIGLRRVVGADSNQIFRQIIGEAWVLATFGIIVGAFIAMQAPLLQFIEGIKSSTYILALVFSAGMIYLIVTLCALYPSRLAARVQPAEALHDE